MNPEIVNFYSEGSLIEGHLYKPLDLLENQKRPAIILCHGFCGIKEVLLPPYAKYFCEAGFITFTFDYRGFGNSEGVRGKLVPKEQIRDIRNAISYMSSLSQVNTEKIGLWGTSFGGANAISTAVIDKRVKCVSVQGTFGNGERLILSNLSDEEKEKLITTLDKAWQREVVKNKVLMVNPEQILTDDESKVFYAETIKKVPEFKTKLPLLTIKHNLEYKPEESLGALNVPFLIVAAGNDVVCPVSESIHLFEKANEPKSLFVIEGAKHYDLYEGDSFNISSNKALDWFSKYLK